MIAAEKQEQAMQAVEDVLSKSPDWVAFYREVLGVRGILRQMFPTRDALAAFEQTDAYREIQRTLTKLCGTKPMALQTDESTRVITVRLPESLHETLRAEAYENHTSMNKVCISKLMQLVDGEAIPRKMNNAGPQSPELE